MNPSRRTLEERIIDIKGKKLWSGDKKPAKEWDIRPLTGEDEEAVTELADALLNETYRSITRNIG